MSFIDYSDEEKWKKGLSALDDGSVIEMCEKSYYHFLNCVPPLVHQSTAFMSGEPHHHNDDGESVHLCAIEKNGKYYAQHGTIKQFVNRELFKTV